MLKINSNKLQELTGIETLNPVELLLICKMLADGLKGRSKADKINIETLKNIFEAIETE